MSRSHNITFAALFAVAAFAFGHAADAATRGDDASIARGRYIVRIAGCNDCHTAGYAASGGTIPEKDWLLGDTVGWHGDWGTTYPPNLRLVLSAMNEDQWVKSAKTVQGRPPMPWFALRDMTEQDLRAVYRFVRQLRPVGTPSPAYVPPGTTPAGPVIRFPAAPK